MVLAKCAAPPSGRSSRATAVTTTKRSPMARGGLRHPAGLVGVRQARWAARSSTLQNRQPRVQRLPAIMKVAVPRDQHLPMFGQAASSQTVTRSDERISALVRTKPDERGFLATTHRGSRRRSQSWVSSSAVTSTGSRSSSGPSPIRRPPRITSGTWPAARAASTAWRAGTLGPSSTMNARSTATSLTVANHRGARYARRPWSCPTERSARSSPPDGS